MKYASPLLIIFFLISCNNEQKNMEVADKNWSKDESISMNSQFAELEDQEIELFLSTHRDWKMTETGTGLRYMIYQKGDSTRHPKVGNNVTVDFEISLLSGEVCYSSSENGAEAFLVEKSDVESGLHEGIKYLSVGDKAKFILPSRSAHGLIGDTDKIPPLSPVIYDIELLKID